MMKNGFKGGKGMIKNKKKSKRHVRMFRTELEARYHCVVLRKHSRVFKDTVACFRVDSNRYQVQWNDA